MRARGPAISLHIERVLLDGPALGPDGAAQLRTALEQELTRLLGEGGGSSSLRGGALAGLRAPPVQVPGVRPAALGHQIAHAVHATLMRPT